MSPSNLISSTCRRWRPLTSALATLVLFTDLSLHPSSTIFASASSSSPNVDTCLPEKNKSPTSQKKVLVLDVDNTLYQERFAGIERQIVANTHAYCEQRLGISKEQADDLYRTYGSTVEGLRHTVWKSLSADDLEQQLRHFYETVYASDAIDMSNLLPMLRDMNEQSTGYSHAQMMTEERTLRTLLQNFPHPILLASNSPRSHVDRVLQHMGYGDSTSPSYPSNFRAVFTPDRRKGYPTKNDPISFFYGSHTEFPYITSDTTIVVADDSMHNLETIGKAFSSDMELVHIDPSHGKTLLRELWKQSGLIDTSYRFDQEQYLESKNVVDRASIHVPTYEHVVHALQNKARLDRPLRIVDVGAGLLSMLHIFLFGDPDNELPPLSLSSGNTIRLEYTAFESNKALFHKCQNKVQLWGFQLTQQLSDAEHIYEHAELGVRLRICMSDFDSKQEQGQHKAPDLIVGCCFADLFHPNQLASSLIQRFELLQQQHDGTLLYFPITFTGTTQFLPPKPFEKSDNNDDGGSNAMIPSDTHAFQVYSEALADDMGHNLDPSLLVKAFQDHGVELVCQGPSPWKIDAQEHSYLKDTMNYFFATAAGPRLMESGWDAVGWIQRARLQEPNIQVSNVDLLFHLKSQHSNTAEAETAGQAKKKSANLSSRTEIQFVAPRKVTCAPQPIPKLEPNQVLIESSCSLISSGTELKIFKGTFDTDAALDVNIQGMDEERMMYPLSYGYSLVGKIIRCGSAVNTRQYLGKTVFTFSPHATHVVTHVNSIQLVPDGIAPQDAIFMPSVETALSLVHDAHVRLGERVGVYGQGLIGLLVTAILRSQTTSAKFGTITTFDTIPDRLAASSKMGATQALLPGTTVMQPFDVTIEVSGNGRALQSAIDCTADGGRVVIGSWYGNDTVPLKLGIDFHRSHKTLMTSQVSTIPAQLLGLWTKERRFALTWELVRQIRPSRLISKTMTLSQAQAAYEALEAGSEIAVSFTYP